MRFHVPESGAEVNRHVLVPLLEAAVFFHVVKIFSADDNCPLHLHPQHHARQDTAADADVAGEGAFLVDVRPHCSLQCQT